MLIKYKRYNKETLEKDHTDMHNKIYVNQKMY